MEPPLTSKVLRAPNLKRGQENIRIQDRIKLERVLGVTVSSNAALDCNTTSELVAYPAGCTVVLFNPRKNTQFHVLNGSRKTVTSLALSTDGRLLVTGECGHTPNVRVWDISDPRNAIQIAEFSSHKYGINCVAFSPNNKYVVSVGSQHDMIVNVWDWRNNVKVASNKVSSKVKAVSFAENGDYFVTVGNRHVKFWFLEYCRNAKYKEPVPLMGRSAILGEQRNNDFVDVACGRGEMADSTYAITKTGLLCEFNNRRLLDKWVELRTTSANCMAVGEKSIFIGCAEGIIRCFSPTTLQFITTLPRTHYLGVDVAQGLSIGHMSQHPPNARYPDAVALAFDEQNNKLTCVYNDHSIYVWDIRDIRRVGKSHSFLYHSACIWGVEMYPCGSETDNAMPAGSFITCSSDDTIRIWNLQKDLPADESLYNRNIYSNELLKIIYVDPELTYLKDLDLAAAGSDKSDSSYDSRNGVRSIRVSPDGKQLASGDRCGNIRIHDISNLDEICVIEAHDAEVLCLEYSKYTKSSVDSPRLLASASRDRLIHVFNVDEGYNFLQTLDDHSSSITAVRFFNQTNQTDRIQMVSCGADKSIIFRQLQATPGGSPQFSRGHNVAGKTTLYDMEVDSGQKHVLTACQDRNIRVYNTATGKHSKTFKGSVGEDGSLIKVVLDASGIYVATSCTDKTLCVYDYYSGECMATMLGHSELVTGLRFTPDCRHLVSASGDGCIFVWKVPHDMVVTMQARLAQQAIRAGKKVPIPNGSVALDNESFGSPPADFLEPNANQPMPSLGDYRFSVGQLPQWAKKQINTTEETTVVSSGVRSLGVDMPKGRWAQRVQQVDGITVKSVYDSDEIIPFPPPRSAIDSDGGGGGQGGSKDSSIDSGTETKCSSDYRRETITVKTEHDEVYAFELCPDSYLELNDSFKQAATGNVTVTRGNNVPELIARQSRTRHHTDDSSLGSFKFEDHESTEHDGDVEDYSEGENGTTGSEKSNHHLMYYPSPDDIVSNQFKVNAMDVEELRRSQRRSKKIRVGENGRGELTASGSQDDSDSEGGASTPSAERNPLSMLSEASSEGFDQLANQSHREKYLKNAFESLSGADEPTNRKNTSISSQFHGRNSGGEVNQTRVTPTINAPKNQKSDADVTKKREELKRRIEETRKKLQSVGYKSSLKSSQSISDLTTHIPARHRQNRSGTGNITSTQLVRYAIPTNPVKPQPKTQSIQLKSQSHTNNANATIFKIHEPMQLTIPKSQTMSSVNEKISSNSARPVTLTLKKTEKYHLSLKNKPNQSLPESPVCEELKILKEKCKKSLNGFTKFAQKRRSCSYFIGLNDEADDVDKITKSVESLPAMNDADNDDGNFSDDSLESEYKNPPRRCISEYQINLDSQVDSKNSLNLMKRRFNESQESILSDASVEVFDCVQYDNDRHSSASFFLSRKKQATQSHESILTDCTDDYQIFPLRENEDHRSTESILSDDSDSLVKSAPLEMLFDSHYKRKRQNSETYNANPKNQNELEEQDDNLLKPSPNRPVFRSKSLQDTSLNATKASINYTEENFRPNKQCIYYEFNVDNTDEYNMKVRTPRSEMSRSKSMKIPKEPQSMLILDDFVPHKPPKPTRHFSRTQSMRNRARPSWNRYSLEIPQQKQLSDLNKENENERMQDVRPNDQEIKAIQVAQKVINVGIVTPCHSNASNQIIVNKIEQQFERFEKLERKVEEVDADSGFENQIPTKDTAENYDSLEPNGTSSADVSTSDTQDSNRDIEKYENCNANVDIRITRAIEGTVKLLSKEFESLVRREQYFTKERQSWRIQQKENEHFAKLEADGNRRFLLRREHRKSSGGEDSDCMDKSVMESGSSTPGSSCTNSPKRIWPPASRCQLKWTKTLPSLGQNLLPSKHSFAAAVSGRSHVSSKTNDEDEETGGMRRACSLSDLSVSPPNKLLHGPIRVSGKTSNKSSNQPRNSVSGNSASSSRYGSAKMHSNHMTRSNSVGVLNQQSDSESDAGITSSTRYWANQGQVSRMSGVMRPTISSQNKINHQTKQNSNSSNNMPILMRRRGMQSAYSSVNLSQVGNQEDSSSEDTSSNGNGSNNKPALPPRPRSINIEPSSLNTVPAIRKSGPNQAIPNGRSNIQIAQGGPRLPSRKQLDPSPQELPVKDTDHAIDIAGAELSPQLCNTIADELTRTADNVVQLYKRLTMDTAGNTSGETIDRETMLRGLESSVNEAMRTLRLVAAGAKETTGEGQLPTNEAAETFQELLAGQDQGRVVTMMQQYSDMLLTMMQQRMGGTQPNHA